jgi:hypothetical protein
MKTALIGAYAASPSATGFDARTEEKFLDAVIGLDGVGGLEIPFLGSLHSQDDTWFFDYLVQTQKRRPELRHVMTLIPGVMTRLSKEHHFGLASDDLEGQRLAIEQVKDALQWITRLEQASGSLLFSAIEVHSAPTLGSQGVKSSIGALTRALHQLAEYSTRQSFWLEHCDAFVPGQAPAKGFLTLDQEMEALSGLPRERFGILINWGRSAIEGRSAQSALSHIKKAQIADRLSCLIFSGATQDDALYGDWADSHAPFDTAGSVLSRAATHDALSAAGEKTVLGLKMQALPKTLSVDERIEFVSRQLRILKSGIESLN